MWTKTLFSLITIALIYNFSMLFLNLLEIIVFKMEQQKDLYRYSIQFIIFSTALIILLCF